MQWVNSLTSYGAVARFLHWSIAALVLLALPLGIWASYIGPRNPDATLHAWREDILFIHKSFGVTVFALMIVRVFWACYSRRPPLPKSLRSAERYTAKLTQFALYLVLLAMSPSGVYLSQSAGFDVSPFGLFTLPAFAEPDLSTPVPQRPGVILGTFLHKQWLAYALYAVLALHLMGVFKHVVIDRDRLLLARMWGRPLQTTAEHQD